MEAEIVEVATAPTEAPEILGEMSDTGTSIEGNEILEAQGLSMPTMDELNGIEPQADVKSEEQASSEPEKEAESTEKEEPKTVPLAALHEARLDNKSIRTERDAATAQIALLNQQLLMAQQAAQVAPVQEPVPDFVELKPEQVEELLDESPAEYHKYMLAQQENRFKAYTDQVTKTETDKQEALVEQQQQVAYDADNKEISEAQDKMAEVFPGLYSEDKADYNKLVSYLDGVGISEEVASFMTDPNTLIRTAEGSPRVLGKDAATMLSGFVAAMNNAETSKTSAVAQVQETLVNKMKLGESLESVALASDIPSAQGAAPTGNMSVAQAQGSMTAEDFVKFMS